MSISLTDFSHLLTSAYTGTYRPIVASPYIYPYIQTASGRRINIYVTIAPSDPNVYYVQDIEFKKLEAAYLFPFDTLNTYSATGTFLHYKHFSPTARVGTKLNLPGRAQRNRPAYSAPGSVGFNKDQYRSHRFAPRPGVGKACAVRNYGGAHRSQR